MQTNNYKANKKSDSYLNFIIISINKEITNFNFMRSHKNTMVIQAFKVFLSINTIEELNH